MASSKPKSKSSASRSNASNYSQIYKNAAAGAAPTQTTAPVPSKAAAADVPAARVKTSDDVDWAHEYGYVVGDLTRLGLVTAGLVIGIIVVGLFI